MVETRSLQLRPARHSRWTGNSLRSLANVQPVKKFKKVLFTLYCNPNVFPFGVSRSNSKLLHPLQLGFFQASDLFQIVSRSVNLVFLSRISISLLLGPVSQSVVLMFICWEFLFWFCNERELSLLVEMPFPKFVQHCSFSC